MPIASAIAVTLNSTCAGRGFLGWFQKHCTTVSSVPSATVSGGVSSINPNSMNRKFSDRVPLMPGTRMRSPEQQMATSR